MKFLLNDNVPVTPRNYQEISLGLNFTENPEILNLGVDSLVFVGNGQDEAVGMIYSHLAQYGATEGMPLTVITNSGQSLRYFIDFTERPIFRDSPDSNVEVEVKIKRRFANESFFMQADGFTFDLGAKKKGINYEVFDTPYAIIETNQVMKGLIISVALYTMTQALADAIQKTTDIAAEFVSAVGVDVSDALAAGIKLAAQIAYLTALVIAIKKLCDQLRELIFPKIRYFKASKLRTLIVKSCEYLGYTVQSSLLDSLSNLTILPVPIIKAKEDILQNIENDLNFAFTKGYPSTQDTVNTLGDSIRAVETTFNAKTTVFDGVVRIERRDFQFNMYSNNLVKALNVQAKRMDEYELNTSQLWKRCYISYQVDYSDTHTANSFDSTDNEQSTEPVVVNNPDLVSIRGLKRVDVPFALGVRKNVLNWLEKRVKSFFEFVDAITSIFGNGTNFAGLISNRIGVTQVSQQFFSVTKLLWTVAGKQPANYLNYISARALWNGYHYIDYIRNNSFKIFSNVPVMLSDSDFLALQNCNYATINGVENCEILTVEYSEFKQHSTLSYKEPFDWAFNTKVITIND